VNIIVKMALKFKFFLNNMILRLTQKLAKKIKEAPAASLASEVNPYADWSGHVFTADRTQYIIVSNTMSLYSMVFYGSGVTDLSRFMGDLQSFMADYMSRDGYEFQFRRFIVPEMTEIRISKLTDRQVIGSMDDLVYNCKVHLIENGLSPFDAAQRINDMPMSYLNYASPKEAFARMKPEAENFS
jgi:hypothetical protein